MKIADRMIASIRSSGPVDSRNREADGIDVMVVDFQQKRIGHQKFLWDHIRETYWHPGNVIRFPSSFQHIKREESYLIAHDSPLQPRFFRAMN